MTIQQIPCLLDEFGTSLIQNKTLDQTSSNIPSVFMFKCVHFSGLSSINQHESLSWTGADLGGGCRDDLQLSNTTGILQKKVTSQSYAIPKWCTPPKKKPE